MTNRKSGTKKTAAIRDLSARKGSDVKGGGSLSNTIKAVGEGLSQVARKR